MNPLWVGNRKELPDWCSGLAVRQGGTMPLGVFGIIKPDAREMLIRGGEWVYFDHSYFDRGWHRSNFRAIRNQLHLTHLLDRPTDRFAKWGVEIKPWRRSGAEVVVIPPSASQTAVYGCDAWKDEAIYRLMACTDRPILVKAKDDKKPLEKWLETAWAVVTYASVAGVEAALAGVPVFSTQNCPSCPINAGALEDIEHPMYAENREQWAASLTYASWNWEETKSVKWKDYRYELCE
jgi:hypothetical protein